MKPPFFFQAKDQRSAIIFAVFSQTVWLPVFYISSADHYFVSKTLNNSSAINKTYWSSLRQRHSIAAHISSSSLNPSSFETAEGQESTGIVLRSTLKDHSFQSSADTTRVLSIPSLYHLSPQNISSAARSILVSRVTPDEDISSSRGNVVAIRPSRPTGFIHQFYSQSELLGGVLSLSNMNEPLMPALARAERAQWNRSGDPLAPLPEPWREPMRRALNSLILPSLPESQNTNTLKRPNLYIDSARFVHVPSTKITRASQIPLALQSDGSIDILSMTNDPVVLEEVNRWSVKQILPKNGRISPAVVNLHPLVNHSGDLGSNRVLSESQHMSMPDLSPSFQSIQGSPLEASVQAQSISRPSIISPSSLPPARFDDSSDLSTTGAPVLSSQASANNTGASTTLVPQSVSHRSDETLKEVEP